MNNLQSGTPSSQLAPQAYKNSSQSGSVQNTNSNLIIQDSSGSATSLNSLSGSIKLQVNDGNQQLSVIGPPLQKSSNESVLSAQTIKDGGLSTPLFALLAIVVVFSIFLTVYFYQKYRRLSVPEEIED
jgi:hypothetical protein